MDSTKASRGLDFGLRKAMASDLNGLRWRPLFRSQLWTLWVQILLRQPDEMRGSICTDIQLGHGCHQHIDERTQVAGFCQVRIYSIGNRWYEKNKKKWAKDRALGHTWGYCCGGWGWWVNFDKGWAICKVGANARDEKAGQTKSMLKSVKKCGVNGSIECRRHVESG